MGAISISLGLRAKEAVTARFEDGKFFWRGAKGRMGGCSETAGPWGVAWGTFLAALRARNGYHPQRPAWFPTRATLHAHLRQLVARPGSGCALLRWHAWRRYGAAQLRCLGLPTPGLLRWGGWSTPQMLHVPVYVNVYTYPGPEWSL